MKKYVFGFLVVMLVLNSVLFAEVNRVSGIDRSEEFPVKLEKMRTVMAADGDTFEIGMNPAMNYSIEQLCSLKPELTGPEDFTNERSMDTIDYSSALPSFYSGYCGMARNQGTSGAAWAFSIIGAIEAKWYQITGIYYDFSEQYLVDCNSYGFGSYGGWFTAFNDCKCPNYFKWESLWPFGYTLPCDTPGADADCCSGWYYVGTSYSVPATASIKQAIYMHGAVAAAVYVDSYFQAYTGGCFSRNAAGNVNHAIVLCGWNDEECNGDGAWRLKNSWGTGWGESGFMWIKYGMQKVGYAACYPVY